MANFYRRFIPRVAHIMHPLCSALKGHLNNKSKVLWSDKMQISFEETKSALCQATLLTYPAAGVPLSLTVDASEVAVGGVLEQLVDDVWQPLAFFSRQLRPNEVKYSAYDRELLAIHLNIRNFRHWLEGRHFTVFTDQKPLTAAISKLRPYRRIDRSPDGFGYQIILNYKH